MLQALDLGVWLGGKPVLDSVSLSLQPGEVLAVLGPNGAGKSTLLRVLAGSLMPQVGHALLDESPLEDWRGPELARRRSVLPQASQIAFGFRAFEIVLADRAGSFCCSRSAAAASTVPVLSLESAMDHPHQGLADALTVRRVPSKKPPPDT